MNTRRHRSPYLALILERYYMLEAHAQRQHQEGQERHEVVITYHSPAGAIIEVVDDIFADEDSGTLLIEGKDQQGNYCEAVACCPQSAHFVFEASPNLTRGNAQTQARVRPVAPVLYRPTAPCSDVAPHDMASTYRCIGFRRSRWDDSGCHQVWRSAKEQAGWVDITAARCWRNLQKTSGPRQEYWPADLSSR